MGVGGCHILDLWLFGCLQELFANAALTLRVRLGLLIKREDGSLAVTSTPNRDSPLWKE